MRFIVAYDVSDDGDRMAVADRLRRHGLRIQRSVFEYGGPDIDELAEELADIVDTSRDVIHVFAQCADCSRLRREVGQAVASLEAAWWIL